MPGSDDDAQAATRRLVDALIRRGTIGRSAHAEVIETHISWVILAENLAYKIKKPVRPGFLDFSTLELRHRACLEELRLNQRLLPEHYLDVIAIHGSADEPVFEPKGPVIEYAVRMRRFPPGAVLSGADAPEISDDEIDALAGLVGRFHRDLPPASPEDAWGAPEAVRAPADASIVQLRELLRTPSLLTLLDGASRFIDQEFRRNAVLMRRRQASGFVRECHGDLHLGNLARVGGRIVPFDALEFDPALRWIDVLSEVAFLVMDLEVHGERHAGFRFLNRYLDVTGDHCGLPVVPFYLAYRALVRAKVTALSPDAHLPERQDLVERLLRYAADPRAKIGPLLVLMCGISGSGKSHLASRLAKSLPAIHVRSDIERKRLFGLDALARTGSAVAEGIYAPDASARTYARLEQIAAAGLEAGVPVIIDATNLSRARREPFLQISRETGCPAALVVCHCAPELIESRVQRRQAGRRDPSEASQDVVRRQLLQFEAPDAAGPSLVLDLDTGQPLQLDQVTARLKELIRDAKT